MEKKLSATLKWKEILEMTVWPMKTILELEAAIEWEITETSHIADSPSKSMKSSFSEEWLKRWRCSDSQSLRLRRSSRRTSIWRVSC